VAETSTTIGVLDASVAVKLVVDEIGTRESVAAFERPVRWMAPQLLAVEVASALRQKVVGKGLAAIDAEAALTAILDAVADGVIDLADDERLVAAALNLALTIEHKVPDCLYLALAEREGGVIASADRKLISAARKRGIETVAIPPA